MSIAASKKAKVSYRVTNWREYNESLVRRGDVTFWFDEDVLGAWGARQRAGEGWPAVYLQRYGHRMPAGVA